MSVREHVFRFHQRIIDPDEKGLLIGLCRLVLWPPSILYAAATRLRNRLYDAGIKTVHRAEVPVVSVGNITAGGTGKTPFAVWLCRRLFDADSKPAILSRGYGASKEIGLDDENAMLSEQLPEVPVVVDPDRVAGARRAVADHEANVLVMDDGFQHRRLHRDFDLVLIDATRPFGGGHMLPRGLLRETLTGLRRADGVVVTRAGHVGEQELGQLRKRIGQYAPSATLAEASYQASGLSPLGESSPRGLDALKEGDWAAFCGVGNPEGFRRTLKELGADLQLFRIFPDHHAYSPEEIENIRREAEKTGCTGIVTTEKDAVKLRAVGGASDGPPVYALRVRMAVRSGRKKLWESIRRSIRIEPAPGATPKS